MVLIILQMDRGLWRKKPHLGRQCSSQYRCLLLSFVLLFAVKRLNSQACGDEEGVTPRTHRHGEQDHYARAASPLPRDWSFGPFPRR